MNKPITKQVTAEEQEIFKKIGDILSLRIKNLIVKNLKKEDIPHFERIIQLNDSNALLTFAAKTIPDFSKLIQTEIENLGKELPLAKTLL